MQGGINNAALFGASQREARGKLEQMAGIKRPGPSGILASSPELMQAASAMPARPQPMPMPMATTYASYRMPMAQPALPQVPAPTTVATCTTTCTTGSRTSAHGPCSSTAAACDDERGWIYDC